MNQPTDYQLRRWRKLILLRDARYLDSRGEALRLGGCVMCLKRMPLFAVQAHHIRPKTLYPDRALNMSNGVSLCVGCHMGIVHQGNSFEDVYRTDQRGEEGHWRFFVESFSRYNWLADILQLNVEYTEKWMKII